MSIGGGFFLVVVGAILAFAVKVSPDWIDLQIVGYIFMAAGVVIIAIGIVLMARKRRSKVTRSTAIDPATGRRVDTTQKDDQN